MNTKLTLTIEREIIEKAKHYAKLKNRSLSDIIENYLKLLTKDKKKQNKKINPIVESLKGSFKMPKNMDYEKELKGFTTPVIISNVYYLLRKSAKHHLKPKSATLCTQKRYLAKALFSH